MMTSPRAFAAAVLLAGIAMPALAEDSCKEDMKLLCPDVEPGSGRIMDCLREHQSRLSSACSARLASNAAIAKKVVAEFGRACRADVDRLCAAIEPGEGRVIGCLAQHQIDLSPVLRGGDEVVRRDPGAGRHCPESCAADATRLCRTVPHRAEALIECLEMNETRLSSGCTPQTSASHPRRQRSSTRSTRSPAGTGSGKPSRSSRGSTPSHSPGARSSSSSTPTRGWLAWRTAGRLLFNPQFVFGHESQFAVQVKAPVSVIFPSVPGAPTQFGLADVLTAFSWNFLNLGHVRQYLSFGLQWETAASPALGTAWAIVPAYAIGLPLFRGVAFTTQVAWFRTMGSARGYPEVNLLLVEPILVFNLPGRAFLVLDTKLGWDFPTGTFVPVMKGVAGLFTDRQKSVSVSAWYQASLSAAAVSKSFDYAVGMGVAYFFDW